MAVLVVEHGKNVIYLENRSTMVNTASYPLDIGRWVIRSMVTYSNGLDGGSKGYNRPNGF